jgi:aerobic-type carbon monoxide dehydrogenase small subunit (CoxS/CutS family)
MLMNEPQSQIAITCVVNGEKVHAQVPARQHLVDFLRQELGFTGAHLGCEHGICGACTVLVDGALVVVVSSLRLKQTAHVSRLLKVLRKAVD